MGRNKSKKDQNTKNKDDMKSENIDYVLTDFSGEDIPHKKKKKKHRHLRDSMDTEETLKKKQKGDKRKSSNSETVNDSEPRCKKRKISGETDTTIIKNSEDTEESFKKRKKKKKKSQENVPELFNELDNKLTNQIKRSDKDQSEKCESSKKKTRTKKKKKLQDISTGGEISDDVSHDKYKKNKHCEKPDINCGLESKKKKKKKQKKQHQSEVEKVDIESNQIKKMGKKHKKSEDTDSESSGEEKSNSSVRQNGKSHQNEVKSGQWGTAFTENQDKQNKFLRLLGGFKKGGNDQEAKEKKFNSKFANYAMDQCSEKVYQKNLEQEYEKAMTSNLQRGIGLGFQPPPDAGKKFYIDKGASKSKKFD